MAAVALLAAAAGWTCPPAALAYRAHPCTAVRLARARLPSASPLRMCAGEPSGEASGKRRLNRKLLLTLAGGGVGALGALSCGSTRTALSLRRGAFVLARLLAALLPLWLAARKLRDGDARAALRVATVAVARRFCDRWWQYLTIPLFAGAVGWLTNKVAVEMIFNPLEFGGIRLKTYPNQPLGWIGWQGIVPAKAAVMAQRLTDMVTTKLLNVKQTFGRLNPDEVSRLMAPGVDRIAEQEPLAARALSHSRAFTTSRSQPLPSLTKTNDRHHAIDPHTFSSSDQVVAELAPAHTSGAALGVGRAFLRGLPDDSKAELLQLRHQYVSGLTRDMQNHIDELVDLNEVVVGGMVKEKKLLVNLFQRCGKAELSFLVDSGFGFGCVLGVFQMVLWLFYEVPWTLAAGGAVVGYLTNLIALKLIFEPVEPKRIGPFMLQGMFLKRQHEVSEEFAECMTEKLLSSETLWHNILTGSGASRFAELLHKRTAAFMAGSAAVLYGGTAPTEFAGRSYWTDLEARVSGRVLGLLPQELPRIHGYVDGALQLKPTLKENLRKLTPQQFEQLLHPVFQEDELTLILVGSVLGLLVGYGQAVWDARAKAGRPQRPDSDGSLDG
ncbi:hypothetical protein AB1Y20_013804 [Prymnesium parvum]|uniref:Uncharacterized protein n=1 Tax=Prymnesium parvum TaxID=97485 RepID=A0AB34IGJ8_PRYPA